MLQRLEILPPAPRPLTALTLHISLVDGGRFRMTTEPGATVLDAVRAYGFPVWSDCGSCHVRISERWRDALPAPNDDEQSRLRAMPEAKDGSRLACEILMSEDLDGLEIEIQPDSLIPQTSWTAG